MMNHLEGKVDLALSKLDDIRKYNRRTNNIFVWLGAIVLFIVIWIFRTKWI
jgi:hypothetical protein